MPADLTDEEPVALLPTAAPGTVEAFCEGGAVRSQEASVPSLERPVAPLRRFRHPARGDPLVEQRAVPGALGGIAGLVS